ncbi:MAG: hypothetical protein J5857_01495 [Treponema sp.]|nr:hypothetical protein [Treponema sp.]
MKRAKYIFLSMILSLCVFTQFFGAEKVEDLLTGYLQNSLDLKGLVGKTQKTILESQLTDISYGFSFDISTGTITFTTGDNGSVQFTPKAQASVPQLNNLSLSASTRLNFDSNDSTSAVSNTSLSLSADIISNNSKKREIALLKSERNVLTAKRNLQNGFITAEKTFYTELKNLYNQKSQLLSAEQDVYDAQLSFEQVRVQGYSTSSTKYRTAQLKVMSAQNTTESKSRDFEREVKIFAAKCGVEYNYTDPADFLPTSIPEVEALDVKSFDQETYTKLESAKWNQYINNLERNADSAITLSANAGMTFNYNDQDYNTVNVGTDFTWNNTGLKLNAGASIPIGTDTKTPVLTMGVSIDPNAFRKAKINSQIDTINEEQDTIEVINAQENYYTSVVSQEASLQNILWEKQSAEEFYEMYKKLASDMASYYRQGLITESEYKKNVSSRDSYEIKKLTNALDLIIYNDTTKLLFCPEIEDLDVDAIGGKNEE